MSTLPRAILLSFLGLAVAFGYSNAATIDYNNHGASNTGKTIKSRTIETPGAKAPGTYPVNAMFAAAPVITSFSPVAGAVGTLVTVNGANLGLPTAFTIGGQSAIVVSNTGSTLVAMVMPGAVTGTVSITTAGGTVSGSGSFAVTATQFPVAQQGPSLLTLTTGQQGVSSPGHSVAISADGNTAIAGSQTDHARVGAVWAYVRNGGIWAQQAKFTGIGNIGASKQGWAVALSADGNTAIFGGTGDNSAVGAAWVFVRSGSTWIQQGPKLVGTGAVGAAVQGTSVSLSADGNTAIVGGNADNGGVGAAWVFTRSGTVWAQQGPKLVGTGGVGDAAQGSAVSVSADGNTAMSGGSADNSAIGAAWVFVRSGSTWIQQGAKLVGAGSVGTPQQGTSVALNANGNTAMVGGLNDNSAIGATWVFTRSAGAWSQQGTKLVATDGKGAPEQGQSVSLSADGNTAIVGGPDDHAETGAMWVYTRSGGTWTQQGTKLVGTALPSDEVGLSASLSANGAAAIIGGVNFKSLAGQSLVFAASSNASLSSINLTPAATLTNTGTVGNTTTYTTSVSNATASVTVTPVTADPTATVTVNNVAVTSGAASAPIALAEGTTTTITTVVTAGDGATTMTYSIVVTRAPSANAFLSGIKPIPFSTITNTGTAGTTTTYTGNIGNDIASVTMTPTASDANATIKVNGIAVASGTASGAIALPGGQGAATTITILVTAQDGTTTRTYLVTLTHAISTDALLSGLKLNGASTLSNTGTTGSTTTYTASVNSTVASVTVTPTAEDPSSTVTVNGTMVTSGTASGPITIAPAGLTTITIVVTAQDGTTTHTYSMAVASGTDILAGITLSPSSVLVNTGTSGGITTYTTSVSAATASVTVTPVAQDPSATIKVNGVAVTSGTASGPIAIAFGQTTINTVVTAKDGTTTRIYSIIVTRLSNNALLSTIKVNPASLLTNTGTSGNTTTYTTTVSNAITSVSVTPTTEDANATVTVNGMPVIPGTSSGSIALAEGATTTINTVVTAQDGTTMRNYSIAVFRAGSPDATIANVLVTYSGFTTNIGNTSGVTVAVPYVTTSILISPVTNDANAVITVNGIAVTSGGSATIALPVVGSNPVNIVVTSQDGSATTTFQATIIRQSNNALLSTIALTPASALTNTGTSDGTTTYTTSVPNTIVSVTVTPTAQDPNASVIVDDVTVTSGTASGSIDLAEGATTIITTEVTSQDLSTTHTYSIAVTRAPSSNALLAIIALTPAAALTNTGTTGTTTNYTTSVSFATSSVTVTPTAQDANAIITVNGVAVSPGTASGDIALAVGPNTITTVVTSQDGSATHSYSIVVTRQSNNALLSIIKLTPASALTNTGTIASTTTYTTTASGAAASVTVTPTTQDATATVTVNGVAVTSGTASGGIALAIGPNTITTIVTAQDGITTHTYIITITRLSNNALLSVIKLAPASALTNTGTSGTTTTYTTSVSNATTSVTVTPTAQDATATIKVNGIAVASGAASGSIALAVGSNTINTVVTGQNGATTHTYSIAITRATGPLLNLRLPVSVVQPANDLSIENDGVMVHQGVSPNGDGINDFLTIDGLAAYPDNNLMIIDRSGAIIFETAGYDNITKVFDGHSSINGRMQQPGTYFYALDYMVNGQNRHKTGFIVLKY